MTAYSANRAKHATLTANTVDTVTLGSNYRRVVVQNRSITGYLFVREDGTAPTVGGDDCYAVAPGAAVKIDTPSPVWTLVKVICATANDYSVTAA